MGSDGNLVASHPGNVNPARHGLHSDRVIADEIERHRADLLALPRMQPVDEVAVGEVARLLARIESVDADLDRRGNTRTATLLTHRAWLSRELRAWLRHLGALPSERADWAARLTRPSVADGDPQGARWKRVSGGRSWRR